MVKSRKHWQRCEDCGIKTRSLRLGINGFLCYKCWNKNKKRIGDYRGKVFDEPVSEMINFPKGISFTKTQSNLLIKRLNFLFPNAKKRANAKYKYNGLYDYIRTLILNDLNSVESANADKEMEEIKLKEDKK